MAIVKIKDLNPVDVNTKPAWECPNCGNDNEEEDPIPQHHETMLHCNECDRTYRLGTVDGKEILPPCPKKPATTHRSPKKFRKYD